MHKALLLLLLIATPHLGLQAEVSNLTDYEKEFLPKFHKHVRKVITEAGGVPIYTAKRDVKAGEILTPENTDYTQTVPLCFLVNKSPSWDLPTDYFDQEQFFSCQSRTVIDVKKGKPFGPYTIAVSAKICGSIIMDNVDIDEERNKIIAEMQKEQGCEGTIIIKNSSRHY